MPDVKTTRSYKELSTFQLLCINEIYQIIDRKCSKSIPDWNMIGFEKALVNGSKSMERRVRELICSDLSEMDVRKPLNQYLSPGEHYAQELFLVLPRLWARDVRSFLLFWAYVARKYSDMVLPIDKEKCREIYMTVLKEFGLRLYAHQDFYVERFSVSGKGNDDTALLAPDDLQSALHHIEHRNQAFTRRTEYHGGPVYLDSAVKQLNEFSAHIHPAYTVRADLGIHDLCFAVDSYATERQRDYTFCRWGIFSGEPMTYNACGTKFYVTGARIRACENTLVRNVGHQAKELFTRKAMNKE